ncbi:sugar ABC transporter permease [Paenibacillus sp. BC26]|uniref:ABC transporter permease n=1 Tax=Paenibacillus sp. BC26 TaxID=1881032 RepID=UPI0008EC2BF2|nr:ABC transporter permease subunit [Paenibacillus sp. BC26]SFS67266.1 putative aldouronate transport system permease protein [Paenibacillus sp. BC26]
MEFEVDKSNEKIPFLKSPTIKKMVRQRYVYLLLIPGVIWAALFAYAPMVGLFMAFVDYKPTLGDFWGSLFKADFVGFQWFEYFFSGQDFGRVMRNTLVSSVLTLSIGFVLPIFIAITLNEVRINWFKRTVQTASYLPFFISWVVAASIVITLLSAEGPVNQLLMKVGVVEQGVLFMQEGKMFWIIIALSNAWKDMGYNSIMYLAAIAAIPTELFEAAKVDGANRLKQIWHVLLPMLRPTIIILLILNIGNLMNTGFDQYFLLGNSLNRSYSDVIDTYAFRYGIQNGMFSYAAAVSMFKSVIAFVLVITVNHISKKMGQTHLF